jgi:hypothetical protein
MKHTSRSGLIRFLKKIGGFIIVLIAIDFLCGTLLKHLFYKQKYNSITCDINNTTQDVLVFGSSKALHHYVPSVFKNKLHETFYNCGHDGSFMIFSFALISAVLERYTPKQIIIDIHTGDLCEDEDGKLSPLLPYHDDPAINNFIKYNSKFESYKLLSKIYPYNSLLGTVIFNSLPSRQMIRRDSNGYIKFKKSLAFHKKETLEPGVIKVARKEMLDNFLMSLNKKNIKVTVVISPVYFSISDKDSTVAIVKSICQKYHNARFFSYENSAAFSDYKLFNDEFHLNDAGARKFSADLAEKMTKN